MCCLIGLPAPMAAIYGLGQFLAPLEQAYGWTRTEASAGLSVSLVLGFLLTPVVGRIVDSVNARWLVLPGLVLVCAAFAAFSQTTQSIGMWIALWCFHAFGAALIGPTVWLTVTSAAFSEKRSMAMAIVLCGSGIASGLGPVSARLLIDALGWQAAFVGFALLWTAPAFILSALLFKDRRTFTAHHPNRPHDIPEAPPVDRMRVYASANFVKLALAVLASQTALSAYLIHLAPALADKGFDPTRAAAMAGLAGLAAIPGKLLLGYVFDRAGSKPVSLGIMAIVAVAWAILGGDSRSLAAALIATCLLGFSAGAMMAFIACLSRQLFPGSIFGTVYGAMTSLSALGAAVGPLSASVIHDATGSYSMAFWSGSGIALLSALLLTSLRSQTAAFAPSQT